jgi:hypothetical protein
VAQKRLPNDITKVVGFLARWKDELAGVVIESTYNWYWLVDGLQDAERALLGHERRRFRRPLAFVSEFRKSRRPDAFWSVL